MTEKNLIQGNNSNNRLHGTEGDDRIEGLGSWDILNGNGGNDELIGGAGLDRLHGGTGSDVLNGTDEINAGAGERDYLSGGAGADTFILGDANKVYYIDSGNLDFVRIQDFELGVDKVQLPGHPSDYHMDGNKLCLANGELIAVFDHLDTIDLYSDDFIFIKDGNGGNTAPNANNDSSTTEFNTPVSINVLGNDSDPDGDALSVTSVEGQSISAGETIDTNNGSVTLLNNGQLEFTPDRGFTGNESFSYHISDGNGGEDTARVTVNVAPKPNTAPIANNDRSTTEFNTPVSINVLGNDSDPDGDTLSVTSIEGQSISAGETIDTNNGSVTLLNNGQLEFTPDRGFTGNESFSYHISDDNGGEDTARVTVNVAPKPNTAPHANNDSRTTEFNTPVTINVLRNDSDPDGDTLIVSSVEGQSISPEQTIDTDNGSVTLLNNGQLEFTPDRGFTGNESFSYHISDDNGGTDTALVSVDVQKTEVDIAVTTDAIGLYDGKRNQTEIDHGVTLRQTITVTNKSEQTATGVVVATTLQAGLDVWEPSQPKFNEYGFTWVNSKGADKRERFQGNPETVDPTNGTVTVNDVTLANNPSAIVRSNKIPQGELIWELGTPLEGGESVTLTFYAQRSDFGRTIGDPFRGELFFKHTASLVAVDQHDTNSRNNADQVKLNYDSPIVFDLNGNGIETLSIDEGVEFDMLNTGSAVNTGWLSGEDGFLAIDNDGDGLISSRDELFGGGVGEGFAKLESFDSNGDGLVNESDDRFGELLLWQDGNENGITDAGELVSLESTGITDLNTSYTDVFTADAQGNIHGEHSTAVMNSSTIEMVDVYFQVELG